MRPIVFALTAAAALLSSVPALAACDHPYFPLKEGQTRAYKSSSGRETEWKTTKVEGAKATIETSTTNEADKAANTPPHIATVEVECTGDGIVLDLSKMNAAGRDGMGMEVKVVKRSGVTIPAGAKMKAGEKFESSQTLEMTSGRMKQAMTMEAKTTSTVVGNEKIKVPAGEFDAVKIAMETETSMSMPAGAANAKHPMAGGGAMTMHSTGNIWVVKGIGMVKNEQTVAGMGMPGAGAPGAAGAAGGPGQGMTVTSELLRYSK